jgi:hypothetical protein
MKINENKENEKIDHMFGKKVGKIILYLKKGQNFTSF